MTFKKSMLSKKSVLVVLALGMLMLPLMFTLEPMDAQNVELIKPQSQSTLNTIFEDNSSLSLDGVQAQITAPTNTSNGYIFMYVDDVLSQNAAIGKVGKNLTQGDLDDYDYYIVNKSSNEVIETDKLI